MRVRAFLAAVLLVAPLAPLAGAQQANTVQLELTYTLQPADGEVVVTLHVQDPGPLAKLILGFGSLRTLEGEPELTGDWTRQDGDRVEADLQETPRATARWTTDARVQVNSLEGEGRTSHVGSDFAVLKTGDLMPSVRYSFPEDRQPTFRTTFQVETPESWSSEGPWPSPETNTFRLDSTLPRGFLAAGPNLEEVQLGQGEDAYRIVRVAGATEDETTERILLEARSFLGGIYGDTVHQRFIVVAPDPMFRGGLGSPDGVFLHADADASVVAHEMVHAYQGFQFSRKSEDGKATVWLGEGTAVAHGVLLEVAAGLKSREEALTFLNAKRDEARREHEVALTSAVYGSEWEPAAYTKGAVVVTALNEALRDATSDAYTLAHVLRELNTRAAAQGNGQYTVTNQELLDVIGNVTGFDLSSFFERFVFAEEVPRLGAVFPGQASVRVLGTEPAPPVADRPLDVRVSLTNLDTDEIRVDIPVLVNGSEAGRVVATLSPGASAETTASITPLPRGTYDLRVQGSELQIRVLSPAQPRANITFWPEEPLDDENVTIGALVSNEGEGPLQGPVTLKVDGEVVHRVDVDVEGGERRTVAATLAPLEAGDHRIEASGPSGELLAERTLTVAAGERQASAPAAAALLVLTSLAAAGALARAHRRRG